jgi:filamentous hemagglutinin family protein
VTVKGYYLCKIQTRKIRMKNTSDYKSTFKIKSHGLVALMVSGMLSATVSFAAPATTALPTGANISNGQAVIATTGNTMNINQASSKSIIGWNSFNIGSASTVNYNFANKGSSSLNRVSDNNPSQIFGKLNANGQVILVNPNGIVFGQGSSVNVGSLVASTMNIKDADYLDGKMVFTRDNAIGKILNAGTITTQDAGYIAFLAPEVINTGVIKATMGTVSLAAGDKIELTLDDTGLKTIIVEPSTIATLIENQSLVSAEGGNIYLGAKQAQALADVAMNIKNSGALSAGSVIKIGGKIILDGEAIENSGTITSIGGEVRVGNKNTTRTNITSTSAIEADFIETSGKSLNIAEKSQIKAKTWLIDPASINIVSSGADTVTGSDISATTIQTALGTADLILTADTTITVNEALSWSANKLTLSAGTNIAVNATMTASGTASLAFAYGQASVSGSGGAYTVADTASIFIPSADAFTWKKGSGGVVNNLIFDNGNLRFGNGTESGLDAYGMLKQPFYHEDGTASARNGWYKLTYQAYPLDMAIGIGGSGTDPWNTTGTILTTNQPADTVNGRATLAAKPTTDISTAKTGLKLDISKYNEGMGSITSTLSLNSNLDVENKYTLNANVGYVKVDTAIINNSGSAADNIRLWVGTRDDYVAVSDANYKTKGNLGADGFTAISAQTDASKAILISEQNNGTGAAILFYSTSNGTSTITDACCSFSNIIYKNPITSAVSTLKTDGSYGIYLNLGGVANSAKEGLTWYYAAAPLSQINTVVGQVSASATPTGPTAEQLAAIEAARVAAAAETARLAAIATQADADRLAAIAAAAAQAEAARQAAIAAAQAEAARLAALAAQAEADRLAAIAAREEAARLAAIAARIEADRLAVVAAQAEAARLAAIAAQVEASRLALIVQKEQKAAETVTSKIADTAAKVVEVKQVSEIKTVLNIVKETNVAIAPSVVQVLSAPNTVVSDASMSRGGAMEIRDGKSVLTMTASANANPFSGNDSIKVQDGGVKVASLDMPIASTTGETRSDARPAGIIAPTVAPIATAKFVAQKGVELSMSTTTNTGASVVVARVDMKDGNNFSFNVKEAVVIKMPASEIQAVKATTPNGQDLPSWLKFDATSQTFSASNPPSGALPITTSITVTGAGGKTEKIEVEITK